MAGFEQRDNSGTIFKNDRKEQQNHPDYKGSAMVGGEEYWVSGWIKTAGPNSKTPGSKFLSLALQPKDGGFSSRKPTPHPASQQQSADICDDDIPF